MKIIHGGIAVLAVMLVVSACSKDKTVTSSKIDFAKDIKPILQDRCVSCHNNENITGDMILQNRATAFRERKAGPVIIPGDALKSPLWITLTLPNRDPKAMPAVGHRIPVEDMQKIKLWIEQGAVWPEGEAGAIVPPKVNKGVS